MDPSLPRPAHGRTFTGRRRIRLADMDERGRLRLDAVARFLQDVAIEDVSETGWGLPEHLWFIRRIRIEVREPFLTDSEVELVTWCSGLAAIAAGRRWSVSGDAGGRLEVDSVWIHLDPDQRPARIEGFDVYAEATAGRGVSTRLELAAPGGEASRPFVAELDYRDPVDLTDPVELLVDGDGHVVRLGFGVGESLRAIARVEALRPP